MKFNLRENYENDNLIARYIYIITLYTIKYFEFNRDFKNSLNLMIIGL